VHQWLLKKGSNAPKAAGTIHSDLERGFIRAEAFKYAELMEKGSEAGLKKAGQICIEGKDYLVEDGDISIYALQYILRTGTICDFINRFRPSIPVKG
jgi:ribosome-binding ATPase YchF (GTP1/OBG family)